MDDFNTVYALLVLVMLFILLSRLDNRFGKIEKELNEIKKRMEDYLKVQQNSVAEASKPKEEISEKETKDIPVMPQAAEHVTVVKTGQREEAVQEKHEPVVEAVVRETLEKTPEKTLETRMEEVCVEAVRKESAKSSTVPVVLVTPATPVVPVAPTVPKQKKQVNYEKFIGENLFGKIGILIFVIGVGFFVKYAIDKNWINETFRTVLGFLTGAVLLAVAERLQKKYRTFSSLLAGGAFAVFYLTVAIAFHYYHIFSQTMAFIILIGVTVFMSILSVVYNRRELAIISLVGGFLAPFIVSSGEGSYLVLFTYVSILNLGMFGLSIYKKWSELPMISFVFTCLIMGIFLLFNYTSSSTVISSHLFWFATLFYFIFLLPVFSILRGENMRTMSRGLVFVIITNNFIYLLYVLIHLYFFTKHPDQSGCFVE